MRERRPTDEQIGAVVHEEESGGRATDVCRRRGLSCEGRFPLSHGGDDLPGGCGLIVVDTSLPGGGVAGAVYGLACTRRLPT